MSDLLKKTIRLILRKNRRGALRVVRIHQRDCLPALKDGEVSFRLNLTIPTVAFTGRFFCQNITVKTDELSFPKAEVLPALPPKEGGA